MLSIRKPIWPMSSPRSSTAIPCAVSTNSCPSPTSSPSPKGPWPDNDAYFPCSEGCFERPLAGRALLDCQDCAPSIVIDDRNIEPGPIIEQFAIALHVAFAGRKADENDPGRYLHAGNCERRTARLLCLLHQDAQDIRNPAEREIGRYFESHLDSVARVALFAELRKL